jgi:hypothetical protein
MSSAATHDTNKRPMIASSLRAVLIVFPHHTMAVGGITGPLPLMGRAPAEAKMGDVHHKIY